VISQAMQHEVLTAASQDQEMGLEGFLARAQSYAQQALAQKGQDPA
jgi:hypothetical protein